MDSQTILVLIIGLLTLNLLFVGVYIALVLKEVRQTVTKINEILETFNQVTTAVSTPIIGASAAITALTQGLKVFNSIRRLKQRSAKANKTADAGEEDNEYE